MSKSKKFQELNLVDGFLFGASTENPEDAEYIAKLIIERRVKLGWSEEMCRESWGSPSDINTTTGSWGVHEQWVYEVSYEDYYNMRCLYFENGVLTTIQD